jgi:hypothetical protein
MAVSDELSLFVKESLTRRLPPAQIEEALRRAGWADEQIRAALAAFAPVDFPIPVPRPRPYLSAREGFTYLLLFGMLYTSAYNLAQLFFRIIDYLLPDAADLPGDYIQQGIRWSVSSLIVAFPVFAYLSRVTEREVRDDPAKRASKVRRWLTYMTLFLAGSFLIGDVITLVYNLLGGELSIRFALKVATVAILAGTTFGYYLLDLRLDEQEGRP